MKENRIVPFSIFLPLHLCTRYAYGWILFAASLRSSLTAVTSKNSRLTEYQRKQIWLLRCEGSKIAQLAAQFNVSHPTIYKVLRRARKQEFKPRKSTNRRYRCLKYGFKRLAKIEQQIELRLLRRARRYNKKYPGEMIHFDTKRLPLLAGENGKMPREYLFVAIDDYSRELFAGIVPDALCVRGYPLHGVAPLLVQRIS